MDHARRRHGVSDAPVTTIQSKTVIPTESEAKWRDLLFLRYQHIFRVVAV
jgi:hypothetical protein